MDTIARLIEEVDFAKGAAVRHHEHSPYSPPCSDPVVAAQIAEEDFEHASCCKRAAAALTALDTRCRGLAILKAEALFAEDYGAADEAKSAIDMVMREAHTLRPGASESTLRNAKASASKRAVALPGTAKSAGSKRTASHKASEKSPREALRKPAQPSRDITHSASRPAFGKPQPAQAASPSQARPRPITAPPKARATEGPGGARGGVRAERGKTAMGSAAQQAEGRAKTAKGTTAKHADGVGKRAKGVEATRAESALSRIERAPVRSVQSGWLS